MITSSISEGSKDGRVRRKKGHGRQKRETLDEILTFTWDEKVKTAHPFCVTNSLCVCVCVASCQGPTPSEQPDTSLLLSLFSIRYLEACMCESFFYHSETWFVQMCNTHTCTVDGKLTAGSTEYVEIPWIIARSITYQLICQMSGMPSTRFYCRFSTEAAVNCSDCSSLIQTWLDSFV